MLCLLECVATDDAETCRGHLNVFAPKDTKMYLVPSHAAEVFCLKIV